jgi:hypothetical protein
MEDELRSIFLASGVFHAFDIGPTFTAALAGINISPAKALGFPLRCNSCPCAAALSTKSSLQPEKRLCRMRMI